MSWSKIGKSLIKNFERIEISIRGRDRRLAADPKVIDKRYCRPTNPEAMLAKARREAKRRGLRLYIRRKNLPFDLSKSATSWRRSIALPTNWRKRKTWDQAALLVHELAHARQRKRYGDNRFRWWYLRPRKRWALEVQAYRQHVWAFVMLGGSEKWVDEWIDRQSRSMPSSYRLKKLMVVVGWTKTILRREHAKARAQYNKLKR